MQTIVLTIPALKLVESKLDEVLSLLKDAPFNKNQINMIYSNKQVARRLNVSSKTLQNYRKNRLIEFSQVARKICYTEDQIQRFLNRNQIKSSRCSEGKG